MEDYCDGEAFSSHALFSAHINALQILFYFDELEVANPIGSKAKIIMNIVRFICTLMIINTLILD